MWTRAWQVLSAHRCWWTGLGLNAVASATVHGFWQYGWLHNDYLQLVFEVGLVGAALATVAVWSWADQARHAPRTALLAGWVGVVVCGLVESLLAFPLGLAPTTLLLWLGWTATTALSPGGIHE